MRWRRGQPASPQGAQHCGRGAMGRQGEQTLLGRRLLTSRQLHSCLGRSASLPHPSSSSGAMLSLLWTCRCLAPLQQQPRRCTGRMQQPRGWPWAPPPQLGLVQTSRQLPHCRRHSTRLAQLAWPTACLVGSHPARMAPAAAAACSWGSLFGARLLAGAARHPQQLQAAPLQAPPRGQPWQAARRCQLGPRLRLPLGQPL